MGQYLGPGLEDLPAWRDIALLLLLGALALVWDVATKRLDAHLRRRNSRGARHVAQRLKEELLVLGVISLLLVSFQGSLLLICVDTDYWGCEGAEPGTCDADCAEAESLCGGREPLWSPLALHEAHLLLFCIGVTHVAYAGASMSLTLWKVRRWRRYEDDAAARGARRIHVRFLPRPGEPWPLHAAKCCVGMLADSVTRDVYAGLRTLFLERLDLEPDFDFHSFLADSAEEEFARVVRLEWFLWPLALAWVPGALGAAAARAALVGLSVAAVVAVGAALHSIIVALALDAHDKYGGAPAAAAAPPALARLSAGLAAAKRTLARASPFAGRGGGGGGGGGEAPGGPEAQLAAAAPPPPPPGALGVQQAPRSGRFQPALSRILSGVFAHAPPAPAPGGAADHVAPVAEEDPASGEGSLGEDSDADADGDVPPDIDLVRQASLGAARAARLAATAEQERRRRQQQQQQQQQQQHGDVEAGVAPAQQQQRAVTFTVTREWPEPAAASPFVPAAAARPRDGAGAAPAGAAAARRVPPRRPRWLRAPWAAPPPRRPTLTRSKSFSQRYRGVDAAALFPLGRPRLLLRACQFVYFINSLSLAAFVFGAWQGVDWLWLDSPGVIAAAVALELAILLFLSILVLPVYALTTAAGSHTAASCLRAALKRGLVQPEVAAALERASVRAGGGAAAVAAVASAAAAGQPLEAVGRAQPPPPRAGPPGLSRASLQAPARPPLAGPPSLARVSAPSPLSRVSGTIGVGTGAGDGGEEGMEQRSMARLLDGIWQRQLRLATEEGAAAALHGGAHSLPALARAPPGGARPSLEEVGRLFELAQPPARRPPPPDPP